MPVLPGLQQLLRMTGLVNGDGARNDYHLWFEGGDLFTDAGFHPGGPTPIADVTYFGAKAGAQNNDVAINDAISAVSNAGGGIVWVPPSVLKYQINAPIVGANGVHLKGPSAYAAQIQAAPTFPVNTALIEGGPVGGNTQVNDFTVENLTVDANRIAGSTCYYSEHIQELSMLSGLLLINYEDYGVHLTGVGVQNTIIKDSWIYAANDSVSTEGIFYDNAGGGHWVNRVTIATAGTATSNLAGLHNYLTAVNVAVLHIEDHADGYFIGQGATTQVVGLYGHTSLTNLARISGSQQNYVLLDLYLNGGTNLVNDQNSGRVLTDTNITGYCGGVRQVLGSTTTEVRNPNGSLGYDLAPVNVSSPPNNGVGWIGVSGGANTGITMEGGTGSAPVGLAQHLGNAYVGNASGNLGFYGTSPIAQATLATGASHTVDDVITALQNLGLVKQ